MKTKLYLFVISAVLFASCSSTKLIKQSQYMSNLSIGESRIESDLTVDTSRKIFGKSTAHFNLFKKEGASMYAEGMTFPVVYRGPYNNVKNNAVYNALHSTEDHYDIIIHPVYTIDVKRGMFNKKVMITVEGYGGTYSSLRIKNE